MDLKFIEADIAYNPHLQCKYSIVGKLQPNVDTFYLDIFFTIIFFFRKPESPKSRSRSNVEVKENTPKKQKQCNCKHSRCLKL